MNLESGGTAQSGFSAASSSVQVLFLEELGLWAGLSKPLKAEVDNDRFFRKCASPLVQLSQKVKTALIPATSITSPVASCFWPPSSTTSLTRIVTLSPEAAMQ
jgi:hypothetical protein